MTRTTTLLSAVVAALLAWPAAAEEVVVEMHAVSDQGVGEAIGTVRLADSDGGLVIEVNGLQLPAGAHGFHLHENGSCEPAPNADGQPTAALAAGGHYDPQGTGRHRGPGGTGHRGDLPFLMVQPDEAAGGSVVFERLLIAPRLTVADAHGRALVIHASGDNYLDDPKPLGGGGARIACGVVP